MSLYSNLAFENLQCKNCVITSKSAQIYKEIVFKFFFAILGSNYTLFITFWTINFNCSYFCQESAQKFSATNLKLHNLKQGSYFGSGVLTFVSVRSTASNL